MNVNIVTATATEAQALVAGYRLKHWRHCAPFRLYRNDDITLIVSGIGKIAAANAVGFLHGLVQGINTERRQQTHHQYLVCASDSPSLWFNIGIAGHPDIELGTVLLADCIEEKSSGRCYFPSFPFNTRLRCCPVMTVDTPEGAFTERRLYDMEASAFFLAASAFAPAECIHSIKVVSDNRQHSISPADKEPVRAMMSKQFDQIAAFIDTALQSTQQGVSNDDQSETLLRLCSTWKFSPSEVSRLRRLLPALQSRLGEDALNQLLRKLRSLATSRDVLRELKLRVAVWDRQLIDREFGTR